MGDLGSVHSTILASVIPVPNGATARDEHHESGGTLPSGHHFRQTVLALSRAAGGARGWMPFNPIRWSTVEPTRTDLLAECYRHRDPAVRNRRAVVMVHGGAWTSNDRHAPAVVCEDLARHGFTVFSLDFRDGRNGKHPCAVQDITAGIRHVRANAAHHDVDPDAISLIGSSSGGHLVLLAGDPAGHRRASRHRPWTSGGTIGDAPDISAAVACVVALWPVSDPLVRFRYARDRRPRRTRCRTLALLPQRGPHARRQRAARAVPPAKRNACRPCSWCNRARMPTSRAG